MSFVLGYFLGSFLRSPAVWLHKSGEPRPQSQEKSVAQVLPEVLARTGDLIVPEQRKGQETTFTYNHLSHAPSSYILDAKPIEPAVHEREAGKTDEYALDPTT